MLFCMFMFDNKCLLSFSAPNKLWQFLFGIHREANTIFDVLLKVGKIQLRTVRAQKSPVEIKCGASSSDGGGIIAELEVVMLPCSVDLRWSEHSPSAGRNDRCWWLDSTPIFALRCQPWTSYVDIFKQKCVTFHYLFQTHYILHCITGPIQQKLTCLSLTMYITKIMEVCVVQ